MSRSRVNSSPAVLSSDDHQEESVLEGMAANVRLLLKPIRDHFREGDGQSSNRRLAELRRCNTDLRRGHPPKDKKQPPSPPPPRDLAAAIEEIEKLRRDLLAALTARKSLEKMFSSLGKEKQMIATELAVKVHELAEMEELVGDLRAQNESLMEKVKAFAVEHCGGSGQASTDLEEKNRLLAEQLRKTLDGYRTMKRRFKDAEEERERLQCWTAEAAQEAAERLARVRGLRERGEASAEMEKELETVEGLLAGFHARVCSKST